MKSRRNTLPPGVVRGIRAFEGSHRGAAREFGVTVTTATNIRLGRTRLDVPDEPPAPYRRRLTDDQVREIRDSRATLADIADRYGISVTMAHLIRARKHYADVA